MHTQKRILLDPNNAAANRAALSLVPGVDVQAYDADLATLAAVTLGTGVGTALGINVGSAGAPVVLNGALGTPSSGTLTSCTGLPIAGTTGYGTGIATALAVNVGSAGAPVVNGGALGTPSSGTLTSCTGLPVSGLASVTANAAELNLTDNAPANVTIALTAGAADTMTITMTVKDAAGATIADVFMLEWWISEAATGIGLTADTYSGDVTTTTGTEYQQIVDKKHYTGLTHTSGILVASAVDSAKPADQYLVVKHPLTNKLIVSAASGANWGA